MKLRNKKTGMIVELKVHNIAGKCYESLADVNKDWEDYEEPKGFWMINILGIVEYTHGLPENEVEMMKEIGNYFETKEEAKKAVEKLKAWKRLKECGFRFEGYNDRDRAEGGDIVIYAYVDIPHNNLLEEAQPDMLKDLDLLFGGEE